MSETSAASLPPVFHAHRDVAQWTAAAVADIRAALLQAIDGIGRARLLASGGTTPAPIYRALATVPLDWDRVDIGLVDERWLPIGDRDSNAQLIRETLLTGFAKTAHFQSMRLPDQTFSDAVLAANRSFASASVAVLGMGPDGHTASLFPGMRDLASALASSADFIGVDARGCKGAGAWPQRISITPAGLRKIATRLLLIRGEQKRSLIRRALDGSDSLELPVRALFSLPGAPLQIHWCP
jgi:6-phosphogluconolactonase